MNPTVVVDTTDALGESVLWSAKDAAVYWIDFFGPTLHRWQPSTGARQDWAIPGSKTIGSAVLAEDERLILALESGLQLFDPATESLSPFADPNAGRPGIGYNDAKADRQGRYWVGTYDAPETAPRGVLYRVDPGGTAQLADSGFVVCNGPAFSPDGRTLYFSDSMGRRLLAYDLDPQTGAIGLARLFVATPDDAGLPDGITVDSEGFVWCAHYGGARVIRFAPDGSTDRVVTLPVPNVTSCCFGGPALDTLYITTARAGLDATALAAAPRSGALFALQPGVTGMLETPVRLAGCR